MKTQIRSLLMLICAASASLLIIGTSAQAGYDVTLEQVGPNVVATGTGAIDLTGLSFNGTASSVPPNIFPSGGAIETGAPASDNTWGGPLSGPANFGSGNGGNSYNANGGTGSLVGILFFAHLVAVPQGYLSDTLVFDSATYNNKTLSDLGVTPGTYEWTWGSGADQNFTVDIPAVPEPGTWLAAALVVIGLLLHFFIRRRAA